MGTLTTPTRANKAPALSARRGSSMDDCKAMKPKYKNNKINSEVKRASHTHQVPHIGLPQREPVTKASKVNMAPVGAKACAIMADNLALRAKPMAAQPAITR